MFCFKRRSHSRNSLTTSPSSAVVYPGQSQPCREFLGDEHHHISRSHFPNDHTQHQQPTAPPQSHAQDLLCPISFYPNNVYGEGLDSNWGNRMDTRQNTTLNEPQYYNSMRDPSIPLPPGVVLVQVIQPSAPPLSPRPQPEQLTLTVYPRLPPMDQSYADQQMAIQK
ncbi:hypothetical protein GCK32_010780 [Trichostrongylus colubriformis]|uniref:Uncharacterized protein n=1 Tax=Trichostrongylus colubriformis TaxID=6319 RepID=A0AAN8FWE2_TRICO